MTDDETYAVTLTYDDCVTISALLNIAATLDSNPVEYLAIDAKIRRALGVTA